MKSSDHSNNIGQIKHSENSWDKLRTTDALINQIKLSDHSYGKIGMSDLSNMMSNDMSSGVMISMPRPSLPNQSN